MEQDLDKTASSPSESSSKKKKVCVIGAGISGLAAARELRREGLDVTVIEQNGGVGGQWLYDAAIDAGDPLGLAGVHSSMYASVRLNSPREIGGFSDFPFFPTGAGGDGRRYPVHGELLRFIRDFCDVFGLMDAVRLNTTVTRVAMDGSPSRWTVRSKHRDAAGDGEEVFDAVVVATGHYTQPRLPAIEGMDTWRRRHLHSHSYRVQDTFAGEVVVIVGCSVSGIELALELRRVAIEVHLSAKSIDDGLAPMMSKLLAARHKHGNIHLRPKVEHLHDDGTVVFDGGESVIADTIIYCTGYNYSFPFLDIDGKVTVDDNRVGPLFEHVFPPSLAPSLSFIGIPAKVILPRFVEMQASWVAQVVSGKRTLPSPEEMMRAVEEYNAARDAAGVPKRQTHAAFLDLEYHDEYGERVCGFPRMEDWRKELIRSSISDLLGDIETFRDDYHDSDLLGDSLRLLGWTTSRQ
uniref:Flavin-containing monooxygenase n=1 Tax=Leersia perrieri TaxID=77586 RepID=A0A0D9WUR2_9ORYZ